MKKILLAFVSLLVAIPAWASYPVIDSFSGSGALSSNWTNTTATGTPYVALAQASGTVVPSVSGSQGLATYTGVTFTNDQYAQAQFITSGTNANTTGVCVRMDTAGAGVCYLADSGAINFVYNGVWYGTAITSCPVPTSGDTIQLLAVGSTYTCTDLTTGVSASGTNSSYASGNPGILVNQSYSTATALASFQADCSPSCGSSSTAITFNPLSGTYTSAQSVTISTTIPSANIFYTTDGSTPTTASTPYSGPVTVAATQSLRAIAVVYGSASYTINLPVASPPAFSPAAGTYSGTQTVTISSSTPSATIYYTTDGSTPTTSSPVYSGPISVSTSETINAIATASGYATSTVASAAYTITSSGGQTWYVNGGGGTRYSVNQTNGQCNGKSPAPYPGSGVNQNCAFNDIRSLWTDGSYTTNPSAGAPSWGWIGSSGDTYIIDCTGGASCRIGQSGPNSGDYYGLAGNPYAAGAPSPISGTAAAHTRILGVNYGSCTSAAAKAHVNGGYGTGEVFSLVGSSYVDIACFDITDFSSCGRAGQANSCNSSYPLSDYASNGIGVTNTTTNTTITDVNIHGMASAGIIGATGDGVVVTRVSVSGNASSGWNMDDGTGNTGTGHLILSYFTTQWNGCSEEYPIVDSLPYQDCTDDNSGGYGDGIGTATVTSNPAWIMSVDHSIAAYNTQDGFDLLHLQGNGSSLSITDSLAYGNMGQQLKVGAAGTSINNLLVGNCNALRQAIPGTPSGYNSNLSDFCRAADTAVVISVSDGATTKFQYNTIYAANATAVEVATNGTCSTATCNIVYQNNVFLGFLNNTANGYPSGGSGDYSNPIYIDSGNPFTNSGSLFTNNLTYHFKSSWSCPLSAWGETNAVCSDPGLVDETFHLYGYGNMAPASSSSNVVGNGTPITGVTTDYAGNTRSTTAPTIGAYEQ